MEEGFQDGGMAPYGSAGPSGQQDTAGPPPQHGNLFVKGLPPDLDEMGLTLMFQNFGLVETSRIIRHGRTMVSKGYGFVKFSEPSQADAAIEAVNGQVLGAATLEVKHADADAGRGQGRTPSDNLYIRGLPASWTNDDLANLFAVYGGVTECRMLHPRGPPAGDPATQTAGGLVRLSSVEAASAAIAALNERPSLTGPGGPPLLVRFADTSEEKQRKAARKQRFAGDPAWQGGPRGAMPAGFTAFGADSPEGQAYQQPGSASYAAGAGGYGYGRGAYDAYPISYSGRSTQSASVYIKNLPPNADKLYLYEKFAPLGAVLSVRVLTDETGNCRGVGFVNYADPRAASQAASALNGTREGDKPLHVSIQPLKQRRQQLPAVEAPLRRRCCRGHAAAPVVHMPATFRGIGGGASGHGAAPRRQGGGFSRHQSAAQIGSNRSRQQQQRESSSTYQIEQAAAAASRRAPACGRGHTLRALHTFLSMAARPARRHPGQKVPEGSSAHSERSCRTARHPATPRSAPTHS